ncbi:HPr family phosphocarrier protein [Natroniella acetigena]|uniref:HPr family phosphocarrier protein n=1 Tax=Natroniella acetigena TaxID=52004 RepID=UPI00200A283A|nr:HPr family phosphocarrier protein [Natroniella acetigena]MCK8827858.1 HPr family phosphocarrier protein [Natroniella acetigena]
MEAQEWMIFQHQKGLHARVAAIIVRQATKIQNKYQDKLFIGKDETNLLPTSNLIALTSSNIRYQD